MQQVHAQQQQVQPIAVLLAITKLAVTFI